MNCCGLLNIGGFLVFMFVGFIFGDWIKFGFWEIGGYGGLIVYICIYIDIAK